MNAARDEQNVEPPRRRAAHVGREAVADGEHPPGLASQRLRDDAEREIVDRRMRLAGVGHGAAKRRVIARQRPRAIDEVGPAMDDDVGIGADERQLSRRQRGEARRVILRRLALVVLEPGAQHIGRLLRPDARRARS